MTTIPTLYYWAVRRSGGAITIYHSTGKITGVVDIKMLDGKIQAVASNGQRYWLAIS